MAQKRAPLKPGTRVRVYRDGWQPQVGIIVMTGIGPYVRVKVVYKGDFLEWDIYPQQCRRLKPKAKPPESKGVNEFMWALRPCGSLSVGEAREYIATQDAELTALRTKLGEVEREKTEMREVLNMVAMLDAGVPHALLMKDYRGAVLQMNEERHEVAKAARALLSRPSQAEGEE